MNDELSTMKKADFRRYPGVRCIASFLLQEKIPFANISLKH